jgi:hypothetical protein
MVAVLDERSTEEAGHSPSEIHRDAPASRLLAVVLGAEGEPCRAGESTASQAPLNTLFAERCIRCRRNRDSWGASDVCPNN